MYICYQQTLHSNVCQVLAALVSNAALCWPPYFGIPLANHDDMVYGTQGKLRQSQDECKSLLQAMPGSQSDCERLLVLNVQCRIL